MKRRHGPDGMHLFDRTTGLNLLFEEINASEVDWAPAPRQVSIALTNACDLVCPFCYAPKEPASLDPHLLCGWLEELDAAGCLGVGFGGGEPTLFRHLAHVCRHAARCTELAVTLTTHAHRWTPQVVMSLEGAVNFVRVSVDGTGETYERTRGRRYSALVHKLKLIASSFQIGLNCVVNAYTLPDLDRLVDLAVAVNASELLLLPEQPARARQGAGLEVIARLHAWIEAYRGPVPIAINEGNSGSLPIACAHLRERGLRAYAHIDAFATVKRTSYHCAGEKIDERGLLAALRRLEECDAA